VEAKSLKEMKLVNIEYKRHDPYQLANKHLIHCNMKSYEHEESPWDDVFKGTKSYKEVLERVQTMLSDLQVNFRPFRSIDRVFFPNYFKKKKLPSPRSKKVFHQVSIRKIKRREITKRPYKMRKGLH
jgi:hypothetical protein